MVPIAPRFESFPMGCNFSSKPTGTRLFVFFVFLVFFSPSIFPTFFPQLTPVESPDINFVSISAEERDAEVTVTTPHGAGSRGATRHGRGTPVVPSSGCPWRGKLGSWHRIPLGLGWGRGCPGIHVPAGLPWGWMGQWGCPLSRIIFLVHGNPRGQGCSPKGTQ